MEGYDEAVIKARLSRLDRCRRTAFVAACAERLVPLFDRYSQVAGAGDRGRLRAVVDKAWRAAQGAEVGGLSEAQGVAEGMVPTDEGEWIFEMPYGQNAAAAAAAYAVRTWLTEDPQEGAWGARQVYEAADYAAQHSLPDLTLDAPGAEQMLIQSHVVQVALTGLSADLRAVESPSDDLAALRRRARDEGEVWTRTLP